MNYKELAVELARTAATTIRIDPESELAVTRRDTTMNRSVNLSSLTATYDGQTFNITSLYWDRAMRCYCYTTDDPRNPGTTAQQQVSKYIRCFTAEYFPHPADWNDAVFSQLRGFDITA